MRSCSRGHPQGPMVPWWSPDTGGIPEYPGFFLSGFPRSGRYVIIRGSIFNHVLGETS